MMLRERCLVAGVLGLGLLAASGISPGQAPAHKPKVVQPDDGAPPDQAVQPDQSAPLDQTMPPDPGVPPEAEKPPEEMPPEEKSAAEKPPEEKPPEEKPPEPDAPPPAAQEAAQPASPPEPAAAPKPEMAEKVYATPQQAVLAKEAARLLELTEELKAEVTKAGSNMLSLAAVRKADEVQRLSKDLKEKMKERGQVTEGKP